MDIPEFRAGKKRPNVFSAGDMNVLVHALRALTNPQITRGEHDKVTLADGNFVIQIGSAKAAGGSTVTAYKLKNVRDDYLICHTWDGTTEGSVDIFIAKEWKHRCSLTSETILGVSHSYSYAAGPSETWDAGTSTSYNKTRTDDDGTDTEDQRIVPPWTEDEVLFAVLAPTGVTTTEADGSMKVTLQIVGRSTHWAGPVTDV